MPPDAGPPVAEPSAAGHSLAAPTAAGPSTAAAVVAPAAAKPTGACPADEPPPRPTATTAPAATRLAHGVPADVAARADDLRDDLRVARAYLLRVAEPPAPHLTAFVARHGPIAAAARVRAGDVPQSVSDETGARRGLRLAESDLAAAQSAGARLLIPEDDDWPAWPLAALDVAHARGVPWAGPPLALWVRGTTPLGNLTDRAVAVVGARSATAYGEQAAAEFGHGLAVAGITVISGAAYGIDASAHRGALAAGGRTVAVLGCGVDVPYPTGHAALLDRMVAASGAVLSEYPPGTPPARHRFLVRNRLIAALAAGTVVVEAGRRSGSRNTAATAKALGRLVMAVPGSINSAMSIGCHDLVRTGDAHLVSSVAEVVESTGRLGADLAAPVPSDRRDTDGLDERSLRVHDALDLRRPQPVGRVAVTSGVPLERVRAVLPMLELMGLAERSDAGWRRVSENGRRGDA